MSIAAVRDYFAQFGMADNVLEFSTSSATVELAAQAAGVIPARIAKSLSFKVDGKAILIITAGDAKVDNAKFKNAFHTKAKMLTPEEVVDLVGHAVGGVCPFAIKEDVAVYLDCSMKRFPSVFPAAGSANSAIELTCDQLEQYAQNVQGWGDFCKGWQAEDGAPPCVCRKYLRQQKIAYKKGVPSLASPSLFVRPQSRYPTTRRCRNHLLLASPHRRWYNGREVMTWRQRM